MRWTLCFLHTKRDLNSICTSGVKTVEYGVLKTNMHCMKIICIFQRLVFGAHCLENKFWERCPVRDSYCRKLCSSCDAVCFCAGKERTGLLVSAVWGNCQYCESNRSSVAELLRLSRCRASPLAATISRSYATPLSFLLGVS